MIDQGTQLRHYKREDIRKEMVLHAHSKEVVVKFWDFRQKQESGFGKRPDVLQYEADILDFAKQGVSSFHCSEELWKNPLQLGPEMSKRELDDLRTGWDLILDIDFPDVEYSKKIAYLLIKALREHKIKSIGCKFSGNKGFHIAVPFESFPENIMETETRLRFPEDVALIGRYLVSYLIENDKRLGISDLFMPRIDEILALTKKTKKEMVRTVCESCSSEFKKKESKTYFNCPHCGSKIEKFDENLGIAICQKCKNTVRKSDMTEAKKRAKCEKCGSEKFREIFNLSAIIDFGLISSRHMYRMPYSLHEKSGLVSLPINPDKVLEFRREDASPEKVKISYRFIDREKAIPGEAKDLFEKATNVKVTNRQNEQLKERMSFGKSLPILNDDNTMVPEEFFPPCIKKILAGVDDGRKRCMFILTNFLYSVGWDAEMIEKRIHEWNKANKEPLKEVDIKGHLRYHKNKKVLPPNCRKYYEELHICFPDNLCDVIKNPVSYAKRRSKTGRKQRKKPVKEDKQ
jgi:DNA-directed RNA polymerase subunit RPC12/RpoP